MCDQGPALLVNDRVYTRVTPSEVAEIVQMCRQGEASHDGATLPSSYAGSLTFSGIEPNTGLRAALAKTGPRITSEVFADQGDGWAVSRYPAAARWRLAAAAKNDDRCVVCNTDEGGPGSFKDRFLLAEHADLVVEGMTIAGYAIGANRGIIFLRGEYGYLREHLEAQLTERRRQGLLGGDILGKAGFAFDVEIRMGAGAHVGGEESALVASLRGRRGEPCDRPTASGDGDSDRQGLVVHNVESFAWVTSICAKGAAWYRNLEANAPTDPRVFSVSGDCARPGIYELPAGSSISRLLEVAGGTDAQAVLLGGAAGQCVPSCDFGRPITVEDHPRGATVVVLGRQRNTLKAARSCLEFFASESCGQCTPCREGCAKLLDGADRLLRGSCSRIEVLDLCSLAETMQLASRCSLGQSAPNAFLSIVHNSRDGRWPTDRN